MSIAVSICATDKRGDIDNTTRAYARAIFDVYGCDAITANPYLGRDALAVGVVWFVFTCLPFSFFPGLGFAPGRGARGERGDSMHARVRLSTHLGKLFSRRLGQ